jgi:hypothetical protein
LTLRTNKILNLVSNWHVSDEPSLSDHRYIHFEIGNITINEITLRNPRRTNWKLHKDKLKANLGTLPRSLCTIKGVDRSVDQIQGTIISFYYNSCPAKATRSSRTTSWWNKELSGLRAKVRSLFNSAKSR